MWKNSEEGNIMKEVVFTYTQRFKKSFTVVTVLLCGEWYDNVYT
jgi:hypothetical protein